MMVGRLPSSWDGLFSGVMFDFGGVSFQWWSKPPFLEVQNFTFPQCVYIPGSLFFFPGSNDSWFMSKQGGHRLFELIYMGKIRWWNTRNPEHPITWEPPNRVGSNYLPQTSSTWVGVLGTRKSHLRLEGFSLGGKMKYSTAPELLAAFGYPDAKFAKRYVEIRRPKICQDMMCSLKKWEWTRIVLYHEVIFFPEGFL